MTTVSDRSSVASAEDVGVVRRPWWVVAAIAAVLVVGIGLRTYSRSALWLDEALTVNVARVPLGDLHAALKVDGAPPLYYVLLHAWMAVFGTGDVAVRSLSAVFSLGALVAVWFGARRFATADGEAGPASTAVAWIAVVLIAANPYAIRYATEARMYSLAMLLVALGYLAITRAFDRASLGRLACVALIVAGLLYTQYWAIYPLAVTALWLAWNARPRSPRSGAARRVLGAFVAGGLLFLPWVPTFLYQNAHTGTPWGEAVPPPTGLVYGLLDFGGSDHWEGWSLLLVFVPVVLLAVFGRALDRRRIELDVAGRPAPRRVALVVFGGLVLGLAVSLVSATAFQGRYAAVVFPLWILLVALGFWRFGDARVRRVLLAAVVLAGLAGGVRNVVEQRTQAQQVADAITARLEPGDLVVYCPDQVAPDTNRLLPAGTAGITFPSSAGPERIDWVDYADRVATADPDAFAKRVAQQAGADHNVFVVWSPGYLHYGGKCEVIISALRSIRPGQDVVAPDEELFERQGLVVFPAS